MPEYQLQLTDTSRTLLNTLLGEKLNALLNEQDALDMRLSEVRHEIASLRRLRELIQRAPVAAPIELEPGTDE